MAFTKINAAGIGTTETVTVDGLTVINDGSFGGNLTVGGVLTYEDVTNVDSVGLITARNGIVVGSGITLSKDGDIFATGVTTATTFVGALTGGNIQVGVTGDNELDTSSGNLTIDSAGGTVTVDDNLTVSGTFTGSTGTFTGNVDIADKIIHTGDTDTAIRFSDNDQISLETGGNEKIRLNNTTYIQLYDHIVPNNDSTKDIGLTGTRFRAAYVDTYYGDGSNLTGISGVSIANQGNDRLITATGTSDALNAEANLTYNGNHLQFNTTANTHGVKLVSTGNYYNTLSMDSGVTSADAFLNIIDFKWDGDKVADIVSVSGSDTTNKDDGHLIFRTSASQGSIAERLRITSGGNIGIGDRTTSPDELLHVHTASGEAKIHVEAATNARVRIRAHSGESIVQFADAASSNPGEINYTHSSDTMSFRTNGSVQAAINSNGQFLVGTTTAAAYNNRQMTVGDTSVSNSFIEIRTSTSGVGHLLFSKTHEANSGNYNAYIAYAHNTNLMTFHNNGGNERMRISEHGDLTLNSSSTDTRFGIKARSNATSLEFITCRNTSDTLKMYVHHSGNLYNTNGNYSQISDQSLKENIVDANSQWDDIKNIRIRNFNFTAASGMDTHTQIGCVAQEVETVSPKLVSAPKDGVKTVANSVLYMKAVKALQEAQTRIETLESKVAALEG